MINQLKNLRLGLFLLGLVIIFAVERYFSQYDSRLLIDGLGLLLMLVGTGMTAGLYITKKNEGFEKEAKNWLLSSLWMSVVILGLGLYFAFDASLGDRGAVETLSQKVLLVSWLTAVIVALFAGIGAEIGIRSSGEGDRAEPYRLVLATQTWLGIGFLLAALVCINFAANKMDMVWDWSYLKTTKPGESTVKMVGELTEPVQIGAFFARDSEVEPFVREYLEQVAGLNDNVELNFYSKDFYPAKAEEFRVARDGQVILLKDKKRQRIDVGEDISFARKKLKKFDQLFQKAFLGISEAKKTIYVTSGHGEMSWKGKRAATRQIKNFHKILKQLNYNIRTLGLEQGGFSELPDDTDLVVIPGPSKPFTSQEIQVLKAYLAGGGSLLVFLDVEFSGEDRGIEGLDGANQLEELLASFGIVFEPQFLANDKQFVRSTRKAIDHFFLFTNNFSSHVAMSSLTKNDDKMGLLTFQSGHLKIAEKMADDWKASPVIQTLNTTFIDLNKNTKFDKGEIRKNYPVAMVAESSKSKVLVFSDATMLSDPVILNPGNQLAVVDSVRWLAGQAEIMGEVASEEDIKIQHSKSRDLVVFHGSIYLVPCLVLLFGYFANRRKE
ncbi:Gldg family protein [Pseudobacteriovorax antillogorgiicola]|uniref:ABC-type uncharacterized transport system n=1 Tax=Pseudobacteriovorax antillogorgiicola TaxID=1513793 RepID=A0A1Y6CBM6_9BACT|nr:Gldg family protein [Pseudobacteriovorax antillogorgiicola]TCS48629.1 ABC transporter family protein [Pseudobacteriovorax antillogorgiicola]SMF55370.1 ABC-type uncharacterized transport system [Pseudobacteriovorax antillogorgiicola]